MKTVKAPFTYGTILNSRRAAVIVAVKKRAHVTYEFNGIQHNLTYKEACGDLLGLLGESLERLNWLEEDFALQIKEIGSDLKEEIGALVRLMVRGRRGKR